MCLEVSFLVEGLGAVFKRTYVVAIAGMLFQVNFQALLSTVRFIATFYWAYKILQLLVSVCVVSKVTSGHERFFTSRLITLKRPKVFELCDKKTKLISNITVSG